MSTAAPSRPASEATGATAAAPAAPRQRLAGSLYCGGSGMWAWVLHRITGVLTFFFLLLHVLDLVVARVSPNAYDTVVDTYKNPLANIVEVVLVGAVLFHALNGLRIIAVDLWSQGARHQRQLLWAVVGAWVVVMAPVAVLMLQHPFAALFGDS